ncbi:MAG: alpha/beta hydrolase [Dialister sp.]|nr:alpha/beta hydrolase [Dialister sp.]
MGKRVGGVLLALAAGALASIFWRGSHAAGAKPAAGLPVGTSMSWMEEEKGAEAGPMAIYYYRPLSWKRDHSVFIAFSGFERDAECFRNELASMADTYGVLVACPEFTDKKFPSACWYQEANISDKDEIGGTIRKRSDWTFSVVDDVISEVLERSGARGKVILFGHSAGGQLMHRYSLLSGSAAADMVVAANSGWFTMPDRTIEFPYGLKHMPVSDELLSESFKQPALILLGGDDVRRGKVFRKTPEAEAQGKNRMERGRAYFARCKKMSAHLVVELQWKLDVVAGVGHDGKGMAEGAMAILSKRGF